MFEAWRDPEIREIAVVAPTGWGKTTVFEVINTHIVSESPGDTLMLGQTREMVLKWVKGRMQKVWELSPLAARYLPEDRQKLTNLNVFFRHMTWYAAPANETSTQETSVTYGLGDEPWQWPAGMIGYFLKRFHDRWNRKGLLQSQAGVEGSEWHEFARHGKWHDFHHDCPSCGEAQKFRFDAFQYEVIRGGEDEFDWPAIFETVRLRCQHCGEEFKDNETNRRAWAKGGYAWSGNKHVPGRITLNSSFLSVWRISWCQIIKEWLLAQEDKRSGLFDKLQQIINQRFAQFWAEPSDTPKLEQKGDPYRKKAYHEGEKWEGEHYRFLTVDVQKGHFWACIRAWKLGGESRLLWEGKVLAWENLRHLQQRYGIENRCVFVDSRYEPEMVAKECEKARRDEEDRPWNMVMGEKGDGYRVKVGKNRTLRRVYSDYVTSRTMSGLRYRFIKFSNLLAKNQLAAQMRGDGFGIPVDVSKHYQAQMQSERKVEKTPGKWIWEPIKKTHSNNHLWDCEVMQVVGACMFKVLAATVED